jgi:hypothetical protein
VSSTIADVASQPTPRAPFGQYAPPGNASSSAVPAAIADWSAAQRALFRFAFAYFVLYSFPFPLGQIPGTEKVAEWYGKLWEAIVPWVGAHVLRLREPVQMLFNGSGDKTSDYVQNFTILCIAAIAAVVWSLVDRRRRQYAALHHWLRVYVRYVLGATMLSYGGFKVIQSQFPHPRLGTLLESYGESSPMHLLWTFMGFSYAYNVFAGLGEMLGGVLLFWRRTTTVGALLLMTVLGNVVILNYTFDVPVKLYSTNLLIMAAFLLLPDARRLADVLLFNRATAPTDQGARFATWKRPAQLLVKYVLVLGAIYMPLHTSWEGRNTYGDGAKKPMLYGIWEVQSFTRNHQVLPPLLTDTTRWRRVIINNSQFASVRLMNDSSRAFALRMDSTGVERDSTRARFELWAPADSTRRFPFTYVRPDRDHMSLTGVFKGDTLDVTLTRRDEAKMLLLSRGFHWINEFPFNR